MSFCKTLNPFAVMLGAALSIAPLASFAADEVPVKIGFAAPMTGANAGYGKDLQNGVKLALEEANAQKIKIGDKVRPGQPAGAGAEDGGSRRSDHRSFVHQARFARP